MNWITGMQAAINYIEEHITEDLDYNEIASHSFSSSYHFQRVFSILCGFTLGEYIRNRRLSLAGVELAAGDVKIIDIALKYGYESPDSFAKAFQRFHGILPSQAKIHKDSLNHFSRLVLEISMKGGNYMNYKIENKPETTLVGFKKHFSGSPATRWEQEEKFYHATRTNQFILKGMANDSYMDFNVMNNFDDDGFDFYIAALINKEDTDNFEEVLGEDAKRFERVTIPAGLYFICRTESCEWPAELVEPLRKQAVGVWIPENGYELDNRPEINIFYWFYKEGDEALNKSRYAEMWLPIVKK